MKKIIEFISLWGAILGAVMFAIHVPWSAWAYIPYLLSNFASLYLIRNTDTPKPLKHQTIFFVIINIIGMIRWLF